MASISEVLGRFLTSDWAAKPAAVPYASFGDPQSLNLYAYVRNNPMTGIDADGHVDNNPEYPNSDVPTYPNSGAYTEMDLAGGDGGSMPNFGSIELAGTPESGTNADGTPAVPTQPKPPGDNGSAQQQTQNSPAQQKSVSQTIDKSKTANYMDKHAGNVSTERCAAVCRKGLEAGGLDMSGHPVDAGDYGPFLLKKGASVVSPEGYKPETGDVAVFNKNQSHRYGHIEIFDGKQWVSDFKQNNFSPYRSNTPPVTVYRFPDN